MRHNCSVSPGEKPKKYSMTTSTSNTTINYLNAMVEMRKSMHQQRDGFRYSCMEEFVLQEGMACKVTKDSFKGRRMEAGNCFGNCTQHAPGLTYCEGYAGSVIPLHHAWLANSMGEVIDPTWKDGKDYIGVPFRDAFVFKTILRKGTYGVIDDYGQQLWPLLSNRPPKNYRSPLFMAGQ